MATFSLVELGMKIDKANLYGMIESTQQLVGFPERAIDIRHMGPALEIQDCIGYAVPRGSGVYAVTRQIGRIIRRTQQARLLIKILENLTLIEAVVAARENVETEREQFLRDQGSDSEAARAVLCICHGQSRFYSRK